MNNNHPQGFVGIEGALDDGIDEDYSDNYDNDGFDGDDMINNMNRNNDGSQPRMQHPVDNNLYMEEQASDPMILN